MASAAIIRAPFQIQVLFQTILENSEWFCNVECFQGSKHEPETMVPDLNILPNA